MMESQSTLENRAPAHVNVVKHYSVLTGLTLHDDAN